MTKISDAIFVRIDELDKRLGNLENTKDTERVKELEGRLEDLKDKECFDKLENRVSILEAISDIERNDELERRVINLEFKQDLKGPSELEGLFSTDKSLDDTLRLYELEGRLSNVENFKEGMKAKQRLDELEERLENVEGSKETERRAIDNEYFEKLESHINDIERKHEIDALANEARLSTDMDKILRELKTHDVNLRHIGNEHRRVDGDQRIGILEMRVDTLQQLLSAHGIASSQKHKVIVAEGESVIPSVASRYLLPKKFAGPKILTRAGTGSQGLPLNLPLNAKRDNEIIEDNQTATEGRVEDNDRRVGLQWPLDKQSNILLPQTNLIPGGVSEEGLYDRNGLLKKLRLKDMSLGTEYSKFIDLMNAIQNWEKDTKTAFDLRGTSIEPLLVKDKNELCLKFKEVATSKVLSLKWAGWNSYELF